MSEEMKTGDCWTRQECECPYCKHIQAVGWSDIQCCESCGKDYDIEEV